MSFDGYNIGATCETAGSWHLHTLLPKGLDFFIPPLCASSLVGLRKQAYYATLSTYKGTITRFSISRGEKAVLLDLDATTAWKGPNNIPLYRPYYT